MLMSGCEADARHARAGERACQTPDTADPVNPSPWSLAAPHLLLGRHVLPRHPYVSSLC